MLIWVCLAINIAWFGITTFEWIDDGRYPNLFYLLGVIGSMVNTYYIFKTSKITITEREITKG